MTLDLRQFADYKIKEHIVMQDNDLKAVNTEADPNRIAPKTGGQSKIDDGILTAVMQTKSWNVIRLSKN